MQREGKSVDLELSGDVGRSKRLSLGETICYAFLLRSTKARRDKGVIFKTREWTFSPGQNILMTLGKK